MEVLWGLFDRKGNPIELGSGDTSAKIRRVSDGYLYDFDDSSFKPSGWVQLESTLAEMDDVNLEGYYNLVISESAWNDDKYQVILRYSGVKGNRNGAGEVTVKSGEVVEEYLGNNVALESTLIQVKTTGENTEAGVLGNYYLESGNQLVLKDLSGTEIARWDMIPDALNPSTRERV